MRPSLTAFMLFMLATPVMAAPEDPNAAVRKLGPPRDAALAELERVQRMNNDLAITHFSGVIQKDPKDAQAYLKRGNAYRGNKDYEKALEDYEKAGVLDPKSADVYIGKAVCHMMRNDTDKAWDNVHKAESLGGKFWPAFMDALKAKSGRQK